LVDFNIMSTANVRILSPLSLWKTKLWLKCRTISVPGKQEIQFYINL
jgi:hypothetical protein